MAPSAIDLVPHEERCHDPSSSCPCVVASLPSDSRSEPSRRWRCWPCPVAAMSARHGRFPLYPNPEQPRPPGTLALLQGPIAVVDDVDVEPYGTTFERAPRLPCRDTAPKDRARRRVRCLGRGARDHDLRLPHAAGLPLFHRLRRPLPKRSARHDDHHRRGAGRLRPARFPGPARSAATLTSRLARNGPAGRRRRSPICPIESRARHGPRAGGRSRGGQFPVGRLRMGCQPNRASGAARRGHDRTPREDNHLLRP